jgi:hypothetical protein
MSNDQNNKISDEPWRKSFDSRIAVLALITTVIALAFALLGDTQ